VYSVIKVKEEAVRRFIRDIIVVAANHFSDVNAGGCGSPAVVVSARRGAAQIRRYKANKPLLSVGSRG
jgi:hypothetical protein